MLFIGTQFSNLYTTVDTPAEAVMELNPQLALPMLLQLLPPGLQERPLTLARLLNARIGLCETFQNLRAGTGFVKLSHPVTLACLNH